MCIWNSETVDLGPVVRRATARGVEIDSHQRREIVVDDAHGQIVDRKCERVIRCIGRTGHRMAQRACMISLFRRVIHGSHRHRLCRRIAEVEDGGRGKIHPVATDLALGIGRDGDLHRTGGHRIECDGIRVGCPVFTHRGSPIGLGKGDARHIVVRNDCSHRIDRHAGGIICRVTRISDGVTDRARVVTFLTAVIDCPHGNRLGGRVG